MPAWEREPAPAVEQQEAGHLRMQMDCCWRPALGQALACTAGAHEQARAAAQTPAEEVEATEHHMMAEHHRGFHRMEPGRRKGLVPGSAEHPAAVESASD